ncbi:MAG: lysophospholipid acyltransferase family protein [Myxococcota bacterium]
MSVVISAIRIVVGLTYMALAVAVFFVVCLVLLPSRRLRIATCNVFGHITGRFCLWLAGARVASDAKARMQAAHPAIYVSNHTSIIDVWVAIWLCPLYTCGVAKKEIVYYPFFGQLYAISGHLRVDRGNKESAVAGMKRTAALVKKYGLGMWIWAEGTRSRDGKLQPLKKGFAHLALATRLPIVPVVVKGAHKGWRKNSLMIQGTEIGVEVLPAIRTEHWRLETLDLHIAEVHARMREALPDDQKGPPMMVAAPVPPPRPTAKPVPVRAPEMVH